MHKTSCEDKAERNPNYIIWSLTTCCLQCHLSWAPHETWSLRMDQCSCSCIHWVRGERFHFLSLLYHWNWGFWVNSKTNLKLIWVSKGILLAMCSSKPLVTDTITVLTSWKKLPWQYCMSEFPTIQRLQWLTQLIVPWLWEISVTVMAGRLHLICHLAKHRYACRALNRPWSLLFFNTR